MKLTKVAKSLKKFCTISMQYGGKSQYEHPGTKTRREEATALIQRQNVHNTSKFDDKLVFLSSSEKGRVYGRSILVTVIADISAPEICPNSFL